MMIDKPLSESQFFHIEGGAALPSVPALRTYLRTIPQAQFDAHVSAGKNDFADWVGIAFGEKELAKSLRGCNTREQMVWALDDFFAELRMAGKAGDGAMPGPADAGQSEEEFDKRKGDIANVNERISAKYDEITLRMRNALNDPVPKELEQMTDMLKTRHSDLIARISEARRAGKDVLIPALVIRQFAPKLSLAVVTRDAKDFGIAKSVLDDAETELKEVLEGKDIDVKKEVLAMAGIDGTDVPADQGAGQARAYKP